MDYKNPFYLCSVPIAALHFTFLAGGNRVTVLYKLETFEGPLDLLLHLIDKAEIDMGHSGQRDHRTVHGLPANDAGA